MDLSLSADQILTFGSYRETSMAAMDIVHALSSVVLTARFSRYVATKGYFNLRTGVTTRLGIPRLRARSSPDPRPRPTIQLGGALEFLF
jgi:hypothetical protein